ncbi:unnamed protein product, partial [Sphagnum compactum]
FQASGDETLPATAEVLEAHYGNFHSFFLSTIISHIFSADLSTKPFFPSMIDYMSSGPVCCMVWEGTGAVVTGRKMLGATKPSDSAPGTIRGDYALEVGRNICHGSDSVENAEKEISLWFPEGVCQWHSHSAPWIYEKV